jgi:hypothetical protein
MTTTLTPNMSEKYKGPCGWLHSAGVHSSDTAVYQPKNT